MATSRPPYTTLDLAPAHGRRRRATVTAAIVVAGAWVPGPVAVTPIVALAAVWHPTSGIRSSAATSCVVAVIAAALAVAAAAAPPRKRTIGPRCMPIASSGVGGTVLCLVGE